MVILKCHLGTIILLMSIFLYTHITSAQIVTDGSLGDIQSLEGTNNIIEIGQELGRKAGDNLFHSFQEFNIGAEQKVTFTGDEHLTNVISRVTGGNISHIDGILISDIPNVYFINPSGVIFGPNSSIDVSGSFHVSSADVLHFGDGQPFFSHPLESEVLSTEAPIAYGFLDGEIGELTFQGSSLALKEGKTFSAVGGKITVEREVKSFFDSITVPDGDIHLVAIKSVEEGEEGKVTIDGDSVKLEGIKERGDVIIKNATLNISPPPFAFGDFFGDNSGDTTSESEASPSISIYANDLHLHNSQIKNGDFGIAGSGNITLDIANHLLFDGRSRSSILMNTSEKVLSIRAKTMEMNHGSFIISGGGTEIMIKITDTLSLDNESKISTGTSNIASVSSAGKITINANSMRLNNSSKIVTGSTFGGGNAGELSLHITDTLLLDNGSIISTTSLISTQGKTPLFAGRITVKASMIELNHNSEISSTSSGLGDGGDIFIEGNQLVMKNGSSIDASSQGEGNAGDITLEGKNISLYDSNIATTSEISSGGSVTLIVSDQLVMKRSNVRTNVKFGTLGAEIDEKAGDGGSINITISSEDTIFNLKDSKLTTSVKQGKGNGGNINIDPARVMVLNKSNIIANAIDGAGGNITIRARNLMRTPDSMIRTSSEFGDDGVINLTSPDSNVIASLFSLSGSFFHSDAWTLTNCHSYREEKRGNFTFQLKEGISLSPEDLLPYFSLTSASSPVE